MSNNQVKPCPFCGAPAVGYIAFPGSDYPWHVSVEHGEKCPMRITDSHCYATEAELREAWDTRAAERPDNPPNGQKERGRGKE